MFVFTPNEIASYIDREFIVILIIAVAFAFITLFKFGKQWQDTLFFNDKYSIKGYVLMTIISLSLIGDNLTALRSFLIVFASLKQGDRKSVV